MCSNENEIEISKANGSDEKLRKGKKILIAQRRALVEDFVKKQFLFFFY